MATSPYDNLPIGNNEKKPQPVIMPVEAETETAETETARTSAEAEAEALGYVEVDLDDIASEQDAGQPDSEQEYAEQPSSQRSTPKEDEHGHLESNQNESGPCEPVQHSTEQKSYETSNALFIKDKTSDMKSLDQAVRQPARPEHQEHVKTTPLEKTPQYSTLKLKNRCGIREYTLPFEESLLVPDTMPDMSEILFAEGSISLMPSGKVAYEKDDFLSGNITLYTVYSPDKSGDVPIDVVKSVIPFKSDKCWAGAEGNSFRVEVTIKTVEPEMINERKFTVKGELLVSSTEIAQKDLSVFKGTGDPGFVQLEDTLTVTDLGFEAEEITEISQEINIKDDQPTPVRILKQITKIVENHKQITSGKLVINATINCNTLYLGEEAGENKLGCITSKTDFTQFVLMKDNIDVDLIKTCFIADDLKMSIENKNEFLLQGQVRTFILGYENKKINMVSDAYHRERDIIFDISRQPLSHINDTVSGEITAREVINLKDSDKKPATLICGSSYTKNVKARFEHGRVIIEGLIFVKIIALDEQNTPFIISSDIPLRGSLEMSEVGKDPTIDVGAVIREFWFDEINSRQLEVNVSVAIDAWASGQEVFETMENLRFVEKKDPAKRIPMAVYVVNRNDTLWDIAKRYKSDTATLAELNQIDELRPLPEGMKLFVMK